MANESFNVAHYELPHIILTPPTPPPPATVQAPAHRQASAPEMDTFFELQQLNTRIDDVYNTTRYIKKALRLARVNILIIADAGDYERAVTTGRSLEEALEFAGHEAQWLVVQGASVQLEIVKQYWAAERMGFRNGGRWEHQKRSEALNVQMGGVKNAVGWLQRDILELDRQWQAVFENLLQQYNHHAGA